MSQTSLLGCLKNVGYSNFLSESIECKYDTCAKKKYFFAYKNVRKTNVAYFLQCEYYFPVPQATTPEPTKRRHGLILPTILLPSSSLLPPALRRRAHRVHPGSPVRRVLKAPGDRGLRAVRRIRHRGGGRRRGRRRRQRSGRKE